MKRNGKKKDGREKEMGKKAGKKAGKTEKTDGEKIRRRSSSKIIMLILHVQLVPR